MNSPGASKRSEVRGNFDPKDRTPSTCRNCLRLSSSGHSHEFPYGRNAATRLLFAFVLLSGFLAAAEPPFPPFYHTATPFREAIAATRAAPLDPPPTGLTLPHHALALDLIAGGLALARGGDYERIVLVSPDHFRRVEKAGAVAMRDFHTVLGPVPTDLEASAQLAESPLVSVSSLASHEHGFRAILPLLAEWFPGVPVVTLAVGIRTTPEEWRALADALEPIVTDRTLLIQSTDYSHYLDPKEARARDAETLAFLSVGDPDTVTSLSQPDHLDSKAAQWIQMSLQARRGARGAVVNNRNSVHYAAPGEIVRETTSYLTLVWRREFVPASALPGEAWFFGGDFHFGRRLAGAARDPAAAAFFEDRILRLTGGCPLVLNLEGVLTDAPPDSAGLHPMQIVMEAAPVLDLLRRWKVAGLVLANNHSLDLGGEGLAAMVGRLRGEGFRVIVEGETVAFPEFDLFAASDLRNLPVPAANLLRAGDFPDRVDPAASFPHRPRLAFLHWGAEYREGLDGRQRWIAGRVRRAGFDLLFGCHSHRPSERLILEGNLPVLPSLGNLLFDQSQRERGGALLEVRFFDQGTFATRVIPVGNMYREWLQTASP